MKNIILVIFSFCLVGCATSGQLQIQKKCNAIENSIDTFVCEEP